jgi:hypothetical protein
MALFSTVFYTLCDTDIDFPQSVNSGKSNIMAHFGIDEVPVCHFPKMEKCRKAM